MKTLFLKIAAVLLLLPIFSFSQTKWLIKSETNFNFILETKVEGNKIQGSTRKNAIKDYFSMIEYMVVKKKFDLDTPEFIHLEATANNGKDFTGKFSELRTKYDLILRMDDQNIELELKDSKGKTKILKGEKLSENYQGKNYPKLAESLISKIETNIFDRKYLQTTSYLDFKKDLLKNTPKIVDDFEFQYAFIISAIIKRKLEFSHLNLMKKGGNAGDSKFTLTEINPKTCVLDIDAFNGNRKKIDSLISQIKVKNYSNLIIDLRDNPGGNFETSLPLGNFITNKEFVVGYFPNQKWYNENNRSPNETDQGHFNIFRYGTLDEFYKKAADRSGAYLLTSPDAETFKGKVFILTNNKTGSTAEVFTIAAKEEKLATIVGTKTAGVLLSAKGFELDNEFEVIIPTNDFISAKGFRVDRVGISPDVEVGEGDALDYVLKNLIK